MKKFVLSVLLLSFLVSSSFAAAGNLGVEVNNLIGPASPFTYLLAILQDDIGAPIPAIQSGQRIALVYDATSQLSLAGGISFLSVTGKDMWGAELGYKGEALNTLGINLGAKFRAMTGNIVPVFGLNAEMATVTAPADYLAGDIETITGMVLQATAGVEWTLTPGLCLMLDAIVAEVGSASFTGGGETVTLDGQSRLLPGGSLGVKWYFI